MTIKSRPIYEPFRLDVTGRAHLIVTSLTAPPAELEDSLGDITVWTVKTIAPGIPAPATQSLRPFRSVAELLPQLAIRLAEATVGLRLYAIGSEAFIWDAYNIAMGAGMDKTEVFVHRAGPLVRRVYCTHCRTMIEDVAVNIIPCPACGAHLFVRDHFSRRLAAFMGVIVDAEVPGEIPAAEALTS
jgi:dimethylamine monooxygenase subunit C